MRFVIYILQNCPFYTQITQLMSVLFVLCQHQTFQMSALLSDVTILPFDALLRASKGLIAGYTLLRDLGSECLSGLRRILPIFRPIQMSKEPHAKQPNRKTEFF